MADRQQFANNAVTTMAGTLSSGGSSFSVASGTGSLFPALSAGQWFEVTVYTKDGLGAWTNIETMKITGRTADTFTVGARDYSGQVGNPAGNAYDGIADDVFVEMLWTAESAESLQDYADAVVAEEVVEVVTHAATSKATPVDADEVPLVDSAASWGRKKLTWANIKATLKTYFDTLYSTVNHNHSGVYEPADADTTKNDVANTFTAQQSFTGTSATAPAIAGASDPNTGVFFPAADTVAVATNGAERMRVNSSGNVGIGTSNPTEMLSVAKVGTSAVYAGFNNGSVATLVGVSGGGAAGASLFGNVTDHDVVFFQNNTLRMRINTDGAVGFSNNHIKEIKTATFNSEVSASGTSGTVTCAFANGQKMKVVPTGAITSFALSFPGVGHYQLRIAQGGTAYAITWTFSGVTAYQIDGGAPTVAANKSTFVNFFYDGTYAYYSRSQQA